GGRRSAVSRPARTYTSQTARCWPRSTTARSSSTGSAAGGSSSASSQRLRPGQTGASTQSESGGGSSTPGRSGGRGGERLAAPDPQTLERVAGEAVDRVVRERHLADPSLHPPDDMPRAVAVLPQRPPHH